MGIAEMLAEIETENKELQASFDLRWKSDMRAIKMWQEKTGEELTWPSHDDLCVWLLEQNGKLKELLKEWETPNIRNCGYCGRDWDDHSPNCKILFAMENRLP